MLSVIVHSHCYFLGVGSGMGLLYNPLIVVSVCHSEHKVLMTTLQAPIGLQKQTKHMTRTSFLDKKSQKYFKVHHDIEPTHKPFKPGLFSQEASVGQILLIMRSQRGTNLHAKNTPQEMSRRGASRKEWHWSEQQPFYGLMTNCTISSFLR